MKLINSMDVELSGKRILYVCEYGTLNGGERSLLAWLPLVRQAGYDVRVVVPARNAFSATLEQLGVTVLRWQIGDTSPSDRWQQRRERICHIVAQWRPSLIHANSLSMSRVVGPVGDELDLPSIGHIRDIVGISARAMRQVNQNTRILAVSQAAADYHCSRGLCRDRTHVLLNGIDLEEYSPGPPRGRLHQELGLSQDAVFLGFIGQLGVRKGADVLLDAMAEFAPDFPRVHLVIVGERHSTKQEAINFEESLRLAANRDPLRRRVHFLGRRNDIPQLLNELTLLIHPARQEPLGRVLLEAAAAGIAVVATDVGGTREIFPHGEALLVPSGDATAIAEATVRLLRDPVLRDVQATSARAAIAVRFDARISARNLLGHYRALG